MRFRRLCRRPFVCVRHVPTLAAALLALSVSVAPAQTPAPAKPPGEPVGPAPASAAAGEEDAKLNPILVVDLDWIRRQSAAARSIEAQAEKIRADLQESFEPRQRALAAEEKALVVLRKSLDANAFEARAARFEKQVRLLRRERRVQAQALRGAISEAREQLERAMQPIFADLMAEREAAIMIDNRSVVISVKALDVTQTAMKRLDAILPSLEVQWPAAATD